MAFDLELILGIWQLFGESFRAQNQHFYKNNVAPIQFSLDDLAVVQQHLPCDKKDFPCKYLGVPLYQEAGKGTNSTSHLSYL